MNTIVYVARHSEPLKNMLGEYKTEEYEQIKNEKTPLSINGEIKAKQFSELEELIGIDVLYSSHYVRAISTAKYIADKNNIMINVDERFCERKFGINNFDEMPKDFFEHQWLDSNYKIGNGDSVNETALRMNEALDEVLNKHSGKRIMIVSHATALTAMLKKWCEVKEIEDKNLGIIFNNEIIFEGKWGAPELFKLVFDENKELIEIKNIKK